MGIKKMFTILTPIFMLSGCGISGQIDESISNYREVSHQISLGDSKAKVIPILEAAQEGVPVEWRKVTESYIKNGVTVVIYFARTLRQADDLLTDDEFTPYVFNNGKLVGIGWTLIGGARSQGRTTPVTNVNVQQEIIVW